MEECGEKEKKDRKAEIERRMLWKSFSEVRTKADIFHGGRTLGLINNLLSPKQQLLQLYTTFKSYSHR